jgi:hypothetical protein
VGGHEIIRFEVRFAPGQERDGSGTVDAVAEGVSREWVAQRVWCYGAQSYRPFGTAAEYTLVPLSAARRFHSRFLGAGFHFEFRKAPSSDLFGHELVRGFISQPSAVAHE